MSRWVLFLAGMVVAQAVLGAESDRSTLRAAEVAFARAAETGDFEAFRSMIGEDAVALGHTVRLGRDEVAEGFASFFDPASGVRLLWAPSRVVVAASGEVGYTLGEYRVERKEGAPSYGIFHSVWRKAADGAWKLAVDIGTPPQPRPVAGIERLADAEALRPLESQPRASDLAWLAGDWVGGGTEEQWTTPEGGALLGVGRTLAGGRTVFFEFLRIEERDGGLVYVAQPQGGAATEFPLARLGSGEAVFENPEHDHPKRIVYRLETDGGLTAAVEGEEGQQTFSYRRRE